jgi:hypothetical protein
MDVFDRLLIHSRKQAEERVLRASALVSTRPASAHLNEVAGDRMNEGRCLLVEQAVEDSLSSSSSSSSSFSSLSATAASAGVAPDESGKSLRTASVASAAASSLASASAASLIAGSKGQLYIPQRQYPAFCLQVKSH